MKLAETQEHDLWRAGALVYAPKDYEAYKASLKKTKGSLIKERAKIEWFREYEPVRAEFKAVISEGERVLKIIEEQKNMRASSALNRIEAYEGKMENLERLGSMINEGNLSRKSLTKAAVLVEEARGLYSEGDYAQAEAKLDKVPGLLTDAEGAVAPILGRFADKNQIARWRRWVEETVSDSTATGGYAIVVSKIDKKLTLYKAGRQLRTYGVGIGRNGSLDKLHAGDNATPEGKYRITRKLPRSKYYKALLINYPNEEDRRRFFEAKRKGLIPQRVGIGGLVEIHGGGKDSMTYGCIALENKQMEELYNIVGTGTPVTIVGAVDSQNSVAAAISGL